MTVDVFEVGDHVDVIGTSKGKGFQGAVKRYHFHGGPKTHGQSDRQRAPGSRGSGTTPGRVYKGARGPGHMGDDRVTVQNLKVVLVDAERNLLGVRGAVPGAKGGVVLIKAAGSSRADAIRLRLELYDYGSRRLQHGRAEGQHGGITGGDLCSPNQCRFDAPGIRPPDGECTPGNA